MEFRILISALLGLLLFTSCEKEISIDIPTDPQQIVVEGQIERGSSPIVILTWSQSFFSPIDFKDLAKSVITNATIRMVVNQQDTVPLTRVCTENLPDSTKQRLASESGLDFLAGEENICLYTSFDNRALGREKYSYKLLINVDNFNLDATTTIPEPVSLDSLWYKKDARRDSLGFIWSRLSDPKGKYNAYRWFAKRVSVYKSGPNKGETKDPIYVAPFSSAFEDEFFDGLSFDFIYNRGSIPGSEKEDDLSIEAGFFKRGDTIAVKFTTIDQGVYEYFNSYYTAIGNTGSPFATPTNIKSNINGGLGLWAGYGVSIDTLVARDLP